MTPYFGVVVVSASFAVAFFPKRFSHFTFRVEYRSALRASALHKLRFNTCHNGNHTSSATTQFIHSRLAFLLFCTQQVERGVMCQIFRITYFTVLPVSQELFYFPDKKPIFMFQFPHFVRDGIVSGKTGNNDAFRDGCDMHEGCFGKICRRGLSCQTR